MEPPGRHDVRTKTKRPCMIASDTLMAKQKAGTVPGPPPGVISGFRVLYYAHIRPPITYCGHTYIYIGGREVGRVPRAGYYRGTARRGIRPDAL